jgi:type I restriction enzyme S subunit
MSSKTKTAATKEEGKPALLPKLQFPEFRKLDGWKSKTLDEVTTKTDKRNKGGKSYPVYSISNKTGFTPQSEQFEGVDSEKRGYDIALYKLIESKTFAYNPARINVGSIGYSGDLNNIIVSSLYVCFKAKPEAADQFLLHFFGTSDFERSVRNYVEGGIRSYLFYENFARIPIPLPSRPEQQKIAECLSSVDELMAAQARKLDALKTHKKGLMQQLFPRKGETQPRLRLPEFQHAGEWVVKRVDQQGNVLAGKALAINAPGTLRPYLRTKNVLDGAIELSDVLSMPMTDAEFNRFEILDGDVLLNEGQSLELVGRASIYHGEFGGRCAMQNQLLRFRAFPSTCPEFAAQVFRKCQKDGAFAGVATRTTSVAHLGSSRFSALELSWPPTRPEQQRIASCLSNLDALITAETQKLEALKTHKKGLMQQLFPPMEATEA